MIRQAISCDICGAEKRQTNHWFIATEQGRELRVSGWNVRNRLRARTKHLCGQACLHKLTDEFLERIIARDQCAADFDSAVKIDAALTMPQGGDEFESSARLIPAPARAGNSPGTVRSGPTPVPMPGPTPTEAYLPQEPPRYASKRWHAEAWQRERARTAKAAISH